MIKSEEVHTYSCDICGTTENVTSYVFATKQFDGHREEWDTEHVELCPQHQNEILSLIRTNMPDQFVNPLEDAPGIGDTIEYAEVAFLKK